MYDGVLTKVRTLEGETKDLYLGSYLLNLVVDVLTNSIKEQVPKCINLSDNIELLGELRKEVNAIFEIWRNTFESKCFHLSRNKTTYIHRNFTNR